MKNRCFPEWMLLSLLAFGCPLLLKGQTKLQPLDAPSYEQRMTWFREARFGMFIHWGLYAQVGYNEWAAERFGIPFSEYARLADRFAPSQFHPEKWANLAEEAGMKYMVFTAKHHDGFALFPSAYSDWDTDLTPQKKDFTGAVVQAFRQKNIKTGLYYSVLDWHQPAYSPNRTWWDKRPNGDRPALPYFSFLKNQVHELMDRYRPDLLWFDWQKDQKDSSWTAQFMAELLQKNPLLILNNRLWYKGNWGDYLTPEVRMPDRGYASRKNNKPWPWELCISLDKSSWGYNPYSEEFFSSRSLIRMLCETVSKGGNLLLNVGPDPDGIIAPEVEKRLKEVGQWLKTYGSAIYGAEVSPLPWTDFYGAVTQKKDTLFLIPFQVPASGKLVFPKLDQKIVKAWQLDQPQKALKTGSDAYTSSVFVEHKVADPDAVVVALKVEGMPGTPVSRPYLTDSLALHAYQAETAPHSWNARPQQFHRFVSLDMSDTSQVLTWEFISTQQMPVSLNLEGALEPKTDSAMLEVRIDDQSHLVKVYSKNSYFPRSVPLPVTTVPGKQVKIQLKVRSLRKGSVYRFSRLLINRAH